MRKDFLFETYHVDQACAWGADCILIIMATVNDAEAQDLVSAAHDHGMDVLVEVHNSQELERALPLETKLVGVNNRDLRSFEVSLDTTTELAARVPKDRIIVSESGISNHADIVKLSGYRCPNLSGWRKPDAAAGRCCSNPRTSIRLISLLRVSVAALSATHANSESKANFLLLSRCSTALLLSFRNEAEESAFALHSVSISTRNLLF